MANYRRKGRWVTSSYKKLPEVTDDDIKEMARWYLQIDGKWPIARVVRAWLVEQGFQWGPVNGFDEDLDEIYVENATNFAKVIQRVIRQINAWEKDGVL